MIDLKMIFWGLASVVLVIVAFRWLAVVRICYSKQYWSWKIFRLFLSATFLGIGVFCAVVFIIRFAFSGFNTEFVFLAYFNLLLFCAYLALFAHPRDLFILSWPPIKQI